MGWDWDLCVGLLYEHRFAVLINVHCRAKSFQMGKIKVDLMAHHGMRQWPVMIVGAGY